MSAARLTLALALSLAATTATAGELCGSSLRIRNRLEHPGVVLKPASFSLQHTAGEKTFGVANLAAMYARNCPTYNGENQFEFGAEYRLDTNEDAPIELANAGGTYSFDWSGAPEGVAGTWHRVFTSAKYGRNIETDLTTRYGSIGYSAVALSGKDNEGRYHHGVGLLGGEGMHEDASPLFTYEFRPMLEYYSGYQPESATDTLAASYGVVVAAAEWYPFSQGNVRAIRLAADWTGRHRLTGGDALPSQANVGSLSVEWQFLRTVRKGLKQNGAISLSFEKGRSPDAGFVDDESITLRLTYVLDRTK